MLTPRKVGSFTVMRASGTDAVTENFVAIADEPAGKSVVARRVLPVVARDPQRLAFIRERMGDLQPIRHPVLVPVLEQLESDGDVWMVEDVPVAVTLRALIDRAAADNPIPHSVYLHIATQICNGLEALHSRPGQVSRGDAVLHLALRPEAILVRPDGRVLVGNYGLVRSPTTLPHGAGLQGAMEYLAPEQTHTDVDLTPATDVFALGAVLYELLLGRPMFRMSTNLQTIHAVRKAEVTTQLLEVKEVLPGLDRVLYRALALNPRHRYQRTFVLREDLRGLMAGFSFANIEATCTDALAPLFAADSLDEMVPNLGPAGPVENTAALLQPDLAPQPVQGGRAVPPSLVDTASGMAVKPSQVETASGAPAAVPSRVETLVRQRPAESTRPPESSEELLPVAPLVPGAEASQTAWEERAADVAPGPIAGPELDPPSDRSEQSDIHAAIAKELAAEIAAAEQVPPSKEPTLPDPGPPPPSVEDVTLAPPDSLVPPANRTPAPAGRQESAPVAPPFDDEPLDEWKSQEPSLMIWAGVFGALLVAALALFVCLGLGGTGFLVANSERGTPQPKASVKEAPTPVATPEPKAEAVKEPPAVAEVEEPPEPKPTRSQRPPPAPIIPPKAPPARETWAAVAAIKPPPPPPPAQLPDPVDPKDVDFEALSQAAFRGSLDGKTAQLASIGTTDPLYTRAQTLLFLDAKARGDSAGRDAHLAALMARPENGYNPALLVEQAQLAMASHDYKTALDQASMAERHWARLPSELIPSRKSLIYEVKAKAHTGLFYRSDGDNMVELDLAIKAWERFREHANQTSDSAGVGAANSELAKLHTIRERLQ